MWKVIINARVYLYSNAIEAKSFASFWGVRVETSIFTSSNGLVPWRENF